MIKIENFEVVGWEHAIRGMRNPHNSWDRMDSSSACFSIDCDECPYGNEPSIDCPPYFIGPNDHDRMMKLANGGPVHAKYRRMIGVYVDITAPSFWWSEFDTYKIGTVRNSCSKMHKIHVKEFYKDDFSTEGIDSLAEDEPDVLATFEDIINILEYLRCMFNKTQDKRYWRALLEILPQGYNMKATIFMNYEVLANIYEWRKEHKLDEWRELCKWIESLPYSEIITEPVKKKHTIAELTASLNAADERIEQLEKEILSLKKMIYEAGIEE
jgi:hypothetical protein